MSGVVAGIDIGGTNAVLGLCDKNGTVLCETALKTNDYPEFESFVNAASKQISQMLEKTGANLLGIGIGAPNANYSRGTIEHAVNLPWGGGIIPIAEKFKEKLGVEVKITNDANATAVGEKVFGGAKNTDNFVVLTLGTGLGGGIFVNGQLLYGHSGFAGEIGHILLVPNGRTCGCGQKGCAEAYVSATGICRTAFELLAEHREDSCLRKFSYNDLTSKIIAESAKNGDKIALRAFEKTAEYLGRVIADSVAVLSPQKFFLFGGLANAGDILLAPAKVFAKSFVLENMRESFDVEISQIPEANAAVLGAAALIWEKL